MGKTCIVAAIFAIALTSGCARAPDSLVGTYVVDVPPGGQAFLGNVGQWRMTLRPDGQYVSTLGEAIRIGGTYRIEADRFVLTDTEGPNNCSTYGNDLTTGAYRYRFDGEVLRLTVERDECRPRREVLANYPLRRVD